MGYLLVGHYWLDSIDSLGVPVERSEVRLPDGPMRLVGEHKVELHLHTDVNVELVVRVEALNLEEEPDLEEEPGLNEEPDGLEMSDRFIVLSSGAFQP